MLLTTVPAVNSEGRPNAFGREYRAWGSYVELAFQTEQLRTLCENQDAAEGAFGVEAASLLRHRLADLRSARTVADLLAGRPRFADDGQVFFVDFGENRRLALMPNHVANPHSTEGKIDWTRVTRMRVVEIGAVDGQ